MPSAECDPVSDAEAADLFAPLRDHDAVALAVSGGADSSALLLLYARARAVDPRLPPATVFTVDHRLRPGADAEARFVATRAAHHGFAHHTLVWDHAGPIGNLQAAARRARYRLMTDAAHALGLEAIVTAHHAEDQAETFLARLARGSGVFGLAAMARMRDLDGLVLVRPFLDVPKARLAASLAAASETWCEDPSNRDPRFDRVRLRAAAGSLADLGLTRDRLCATAKAMAAVAETIEARGDAVVSADRCLDPAGWASLSADRFGREDIEVRLRLLGRLIRAVGGGDHAPEREALARIDAALSSATAMAARSLGGARIEMRRGRIWISAESGRGGGPVLDLAPGEVGRWRGRRVGLDRSAPTAVRIAELGPEGRRAILAGRDERPIDPGRPMPIAAVVETAPAVFVREGLVACPSLGYEIAGPPHWGDRVRFGTLAEAFAATRVARRGER